MSERSREGVFQPGLEVGERFDTKNPEQALELGRMLRERGFEVASSVMQATFTSEKNGRRADLTVFRKLQEEDGGSGMKVVAYLGSKGELDQFGQPEEYEERIEFEPMPGLADLPESFKERSRAAGVDPNKKDSELTEDEMRIVTKLFATITPEERAAFNEGLNKTLDNVIAVVQGELDKLEREEA